jgi:conflict system STAND superfamily ATPase
LPEKWLDSNDLIAKLQSIIRALRRGQTEKVLAIAVLGLYGVALSLPQALKAQIPQAPYVAYGLSGALAAWLIFRLWKVAVPPPALPDVAVSSAVKGLLPFTVADGRLFARLGRRTELQSLLGLAQNDQIAISVVRGESGAGKTSLLQAGLAYALGQEHCVYWEAVAVNPAGALLHALRSQFPGIDLLESLPESCPGRCVLVLDQFEQLRASEPEHARIFTLLERIAKGPAPHKLSIIVGFRREYAADWLDFEQARGFRAEQLPVNLLARLTASDALVTLATEAGFALDEALVKNFIASIARPPGVSPVDIAIGVLSLANYVQQRGTARVGLEEYELAGGSEGLLLAFVQQKFDEIPEPMRGPLLKGLVLALVDPSSNQRIAAGETAATIAFKAETAENTLTPWLERLAHPRVRLLEKVAGSRYRFPHERLVPVFRRLTGRALAALDQLRLLFEGEYARWRETRDRRHLLRGKDLGSVLRSRDQFVECETSAGRTEYLTACLRWRNVTRLAVGGVIVAVAVLAYGTNRALDSYVQKQKLMSWSLPPQLFDVQHEVDYLDISPKSINDVNWLRSARLRDLHLIFSGSSLAALGPLKELKGLTTLTLDLGNARITNLTGLEELKEVKGLTTLTLYLYGATDLGELKQLKELKGLTTLTLNGSSFDITNLGVLGQVTKLKGLTTLTLNLYGPGLTNLAGLEQLNELKGLATLTLNVDGQQVTNLAGLEPLNELKGLTTLTLNLRGSGITNLAGLEPLEKLNGPTTLTLNLLGSGITNLAGLEPLKKLKRLTTLTLNLQGPNFTDLDVLEPLKDLDGFTTLTLDLGDSGLTYLPVLERLKGLKGLTTLTLNLRNSGITNLTGLEQLKEVKGLTTLTLDLGSSDINNLAGLERLKGLKGLTTLTLDLGYSGLTNLTILAPLKELKGLTALTLILGSSGLTNQAVLEQLKEVKGLTTLRLDLSYSGITNLTGLDQLNGLTSTELTIRASEVSALNDVKLRRDITKLWIVFDGSALPDVPTGYQFVGLHY